MFVTLFSNCPKGNPVKVMRKRINENSLRVKCLDLGLQYFSNPFVEIEDSSGVLKAAKSVLTNRSEVVIEF